MTSGALQTLYYLGELPDNWSAPKGKLYLKKTREIVGDRWQQYERLSLTLNGVVPRSAIAGESEGLNPDSLGTYQVLPKNHLVFKLIDLENYATSRVGLSPQTGIVSSAYLVSDLLPGLSARFAYWVYTSYYFNHVFNAEGNGGVRSSLTFDDLGEIRIPLPPLETQRRIADYLDKEISAMDAMIEEFEGLAKNLGARRGQLVNRIINKHASVQAETGYPWERYSFKLLVDSHFAGDWGSDIGHDELDLPCVRVADFNRATSSLTDEIPTKRSYSKSTYEKKHLVRDDLLVEKSGGGEKTPVGSVVLYQGDTSALCANFIEVIRLRKGQVPRFWVHMFRANFVAGETFRFVKQTTGIQNLDMQMFLDQKFVVPPAEKQREIADELDREFERMDTLIEESTRLIENLKARKIALITEVVTGRKEV